MAEAEPPSGATISTFAPRRRAAAASTEVASRQPAASPRNASAGLLPMAAVGTRQSTRSPFPARARSRFVGLHTPPSTYSRSPITTGANSPGTAHEAATASATLASGAPSSPNTTRLPEPRSTATSRSRPSKRGPSASTRERRSLSTMRPRGTRASTAARASAPPGVAALSAGAASGENAPSDSAARALDGAPERARTPLRLGLAVPAHTLLPAARVLTTRQPGGHDRARRGPDQLLRAAEVLTRGVVRSTEVTPHPCLAENAAHSEHEHSGHAASLAPQRGAPNDTRSSAPPPEALAACTSPPCASAAWRTIARPRPEPGSARALSAR